ncbi:MAG TPA: HAD-IA family hydrolase [Candidatus Saccharimonadales bacterium]|nr:HAD-IA family hydrolase [Candidatus Saccharimonadales bacterium]
MLARRQYRKKRFKKFLPDFIADSVEAIDFDRLAERGVKACLIDLDGTVVARAQYEVTGPVQRALKNASQRIYIATNRPKSRDLKDLRIDLNADGVVHPKGKLGKPFKRYYHAALHDLGLQEGQVVMIGDRYIQDIFGANNAGLYTVLIRNKVGPAHDWMDSLLSRAERLLTRLIKPAYDELR